MDLAELKASLQARGFNMWSVVLGPLDPMAGEVFGITQRGTRWLVYYTEGRGLSPIANFATEAEAAEFFSAFAEEHLPRLNP
jgi:hypothetical protein